MTWWMWVVAAVVWLVLAYCALLAYGAAHWRGLTGDLNARLEAGRVRPTVLRFDPRELEGLPAPVQRYFRAVLKVGAAIVEKVSVEHTGSFNMGESLDRWKPFSSRQVVVTRAPGFVWDAAIHMLPGLPVRVHDAYVAGEGVLHPALLGVFSLMDLRGGADVAQGELMRFFAEAAWYPTALLPSQGVRWQAVDEQSANATMVDGPLSVTLRFRFGDDGLIESVRSEARGRVVGGQVVPTPWQGRWMDYRWQRGVRVPMAGEVAWLLPEGAKTYWRGRILKLRYEPAAL